MYKLSLSARVSIICELLFKNYFVVEREDKMKSSSLVLKLYL